MKNLFKSLALVVAVAVLAGGCSSNTPEEQGNKPILNGTHESITSDFLGSNVLYFNSWEELENLLDHWSELSTEEIYSEYQLMGYYNPIIESQHVYDSLFNQLADQMQFKPTDYEQYDVDEHAEEQLFYTNLKDLIEQTADQRISDNVWIEEDEQGELYLQTIEAELGIEVLFNQNGLLYVEDEVLEYLPEQYIVQFNINEYSTNMYGNRIEDNDVDESNIYFVGKRNARWLNIRNDLNMPRQYSSTIGRYRITTDLNLKYKEVNNTQHPKTYIDFFLTVKNYKKSIGIFFPTTFPTTIVCSFDVNEDAGVWGSRTTHVDIQKQQQIKKTTFDVQVAFYDNVAILPTTTIDAFELNATNGRVSISEP